MPDVHRQTHFALPERHQEGSEARPRYGLLSAVIKKLAACEELPPRNRDHALIGEYAGCCECHIQPNWLLIYEVEADELFLYLIRTGTHSDLF